RMHGFQLWVNLPQKDKMMRPRYQELATRSIPIGRSEDGQVTARVLAGEALGVRAAIETRTPIGYIHFSLAARARHVQPVPTGHTAVAYLFRGAGRLGEELRSAREGDLVIFAPEGDRVTIAADEPLELLLLSGKPLGEPVARYGPFVMNTQ